MKMRWTAATGPGPRGVVGMWVHDMTAPGIARRWRDGQCPAIHPEEAATDGEGDRAGHRDERSRPDAQEALQRTRRHGGVRTCPPARLEKDSGGSPMR